MSVKVVIVGGVAGGASTAARLRRLSEKAEIILLERGNYISYANCGLPYYVGGVIEEREKLFVMTPDKFREWLNIDVRTNNEALSIDRTNKQVEVLNRETGDKYVESYDYLVLSPGAEPIRPPLPGIESPGIFRLRTVGDTDRIYHFLKENYPQKAVVVGAGYIGLEMAENLRQRGLAVTIVELAPQVLPPIDADMAALVQQYLRTQGLTLKLGDAVKSFRHAEKGNLTIELDSGEEIEADIVILSIGVKPETTLAAAAGLAVERGIIVNEHMQTDDPSIYALGDAVEIRHLVTGKPALVPLAGPANKQGRIVANNIFGRNEKYRGTQGTSILKIFDMTVATTGANERILNEHKIPFHQAIIHPAAHAGYYPGSNPLTLKLLFSPGGMLLGSQALGFSGVDKRIDTIASILRLNGTIYDLQELELAYAPPYSSAKDPVNMAGFVAANIIEGTYNPIEAAELIEADYEQLQIVDVREPEEFMLGQVPGATNIPLGRLRENVDKLDRNKPVVTYCSVGLRSYLAARILTLNGYENVRNLNGGYRVYRALQKELNPQEPTAVPAAVNGAGNDPGERRITTTANSEGMIKLDLCGMQCPGPIMQVFKKIKELPEGSVLEVSATDPGFSSDIGSWCQRTGNTLISSDSIGKQFRALIRKGNGLIDQPALNQNMLRPSAGNDKTIVVFSGELDRALASLIIANGAAAMGRRVTLFFTFWGLNILRKNGSAGVKKPIMDRIFGKMMPRGSKKLGLSKMNMAGMGPRMIRMVMRKKNVDSLESLIQQALDSGVRLVACQMSMDIMGLTREELIDGVELAGVASYLDAAESADVNLFV